MATITEHPDSGIGDIEGLVDSKATRKHIVHLVAADGDDVTNPLKPISSTFPVGMNHRTARNLTVVSYTQGEPLHISGDEARWIVSVHYGGPVSFGSLAVQGWTIDWDTALDTKLVHRDLDGKWIGGHAYRLPTGDELISSRAEDRIAKTIDGDMQLIQIPAEDAIDPRPVQRPKRVTSFSLSTTVRDLTIPQVATAESFVGTVNEFQFVTGRPGEILVGPMRISSHRGTTTDEENQTGFLFDITLNFRKDDEGWVFERIFDQWEWKGFRGSVLAPLDPSNPAQEPLEFTDFRLGVVRPTSALLNLFNSSIATPTKARRPGRIGP